MGATASNAKYGRRSQKSGGDAQSVREKTEFRGFVNVNLNDGQRAAWRSWNDHQEMVEEELEAFVQDVGKLSISWDARQGCYIASAFVTAKGRPDEGLLCTMRGDHWTKALSRVVYAFSVVCQGDLSKHAVARSDQFDDEKF